MVDFGSECVNGIPAAENKIPKHVTHVMITHTINVRKTELFLVN